MPVTRSELLFLCGGALGGAAVAKHFEKLKSSVGPWLAGAGAAAGDAYSAAARRVGEHVESLQDSMAEMHHHSRAHNGSAPTNGT